MDSLQNSTAKPAELPLLYAARHVPVALTPPPCYSRHAPVRNPRFLYLYNRKLLIVIALFLFIISVLLGVGLTCRFYPSVCEAENIEGSKSKSAVNPGTNNSSPAKGELLGSSEPRGRYAGQAEMEPLIDPNAKVPLPTEKYDKLLTMKEVLSCARTCASAENLKSCCQAHGWNGGVCISHNEGFLRAICTNA
ncbi:unnamed protein product [Bursaphelenchus xylophilus]|uniref:(pine wood nematode) hypothetical protein n=1 Tax=Bursaphelenchus xylophilus TaxID=6326 RepID=A0A1I7RVI7_BURXY|nr:unnamed protein product [Bursaphelenchus xylophilus]CAG9081733.1 unnamed protein product [Bursaphelenchus xylophilus]